MEHFSPFLNPAHVRIYTHYDKKERQHYALCIQYQNVVHMLSIAIERVECFDLLYVFYSGALKSALTFATNVHTMSLEQYEKMRPTFTIATMVRYMRNHPNFISLEQLPQLLRELCSHTENVHLHKDYVRVTLQSQCIQPYYVYIFTSGLYNGQLFLNRGRYYYPIGQRRIIQTDFMQLECLGLFKIQKSALISTFYHYEFNDPAHMDIILQTAKTNTELKDMLRKFEIPPAKRLRIYEIFKFAPAQEVRIATIAEITRILRYLTRMHNSVEKLILSFL